MFNSLKYVNNIKNGQGRENEKKTRRALRSFVHIEGLVQTDVEDGE